MEIYSQCSDEDCHGFMCMFHSLRPEAQEYIKRLKRDLIKLKRELIEERIGHLNVLWASGRITREQYDQHAEKINALKESE